MPAMIPGRQARDLARAAFAALGFELRRRPRSSSPPFPPTPSVPTSSPELARVLGRLSALGVAPATVFDVGVAHGTPDLYAAFPRALHVLVEPLAEFAPSLAAIAASYRTLHVAAGAAAAPGRRIIHVHDDPLGSSLLGEVEGARVDGVPREIDITTLDLIIARHSLPPPYLIKVDVQGAELEVLAGAERALASTPAVLLEASLLRFFHGGPILDEVIAWMRSRDFVAWDMWGRLERPLDGALAQIDLAFVRTDGPLRRDHRFATPEQRRRR